VGGHPYFFAHSIPLIEATIWTRPGQAIGRMRKGGSAERFETHLAGGAAASMGASAFYWAPNVASGVGGPAPGDLQG
jgi:hypothetical protein